MKPSEEFLEQYNKLDKHLRESEKFEREISFSHIIKNSSQSVIRKYRTELISFGELRNAIVHHPIRGGIRVIAEPHPEVVKQLKTICSQVMSPPKVIPKFQFEVFGAAETDLIAPILKEMKVQQFSQFPVFSENGTVVELVTNNTIARWLSSQLETIGLAEDVTVGSLLEYIEFPRNYAFLPKTADLYMAGETFLNHIHKHNRNLDCILITHHGKSEEALLGLITVEDIAEFILGK